MASIAITKQSTRWLVLLLGASVFLNYVDRGAIAVAGPVMKGQLGLSATEFGTAVSAFFWIYAPVQLVVGWLCDRFSVYRLIALGTIVWAASTFLMGFVGGFLSLLVLRVMLGIGESIIFPGSSKIIARHVPAEQRGMANAAIASGLALGPALGTLAGGMIVASLGWRAMFIVFGLVTLIWLVPWQRVVGALPPGHAERREPMVPVGRLVGRWSLWAMGIGHAFSNYGFYFLLAWLPLYLVQQRGLSIQEMTLLATLGYATQAVAALALGHISDRWTRSGRSEAAIRRAMMVAAQLTLGAAILGIALSQSMVTVGLLLCIAGAASASLSCNLYSIAQMFAGPRAAGSWIGFQNALGNLSGILQPIIAGILIDSSGYDSAFYLAAGVAAVGGIWWAFGVPRIAQQIFE
ncbi:MAG TPA: MFS transporter [Sphingomicrobium sp.]|nr:MFS transporter [Sphingomicrobium sp.]